MIGVSNARDSLAEHSMNPPKTSIVEDSPIILENLAATLEALVPLRVVGSAKDEDSAVSRLTQAGREVDLVIIDVFLLAGSGLGVLHCLVQGRLPCKRVVLTNYATPMMRSKCLSLGADRVFDKSNELDDLVHYCSRLADGGGDTMPGAFA